MKLKEKSVCEYFGDGVITLDGAMGSLLQSRGLPVGELPERWCLTHPDVVREIHREYISAGARIISTNTFGANPFKMSEDELRSVITAAVECAKAAVRDSGVDCLIALDIGPSGRMLSPLGDLDFEDAVRAFGTVAAIGAAAGCDLVFIETMGDLGEARAALLGVKESCDLPVLVSFAFGADGRLFTGTSPEIAATVISNMGADMVGANCSVGPADIIPVAEKLVAHSAVPVLIKPNAGMPRIEDRRTVYDVSATEFAAHALTLRGLGVAAIGGCCGTTPEYIRELSATLARMPRVIPKAPTSALVTSSTVAVGIGDGPILIGERINPTGKKRFKQALREGDMNYILREAVAEEDAGAHVLDVNVGLPEISEVELLPRAVREISAVTALPLQLDSADGEAMSAALRIYHGAALINSVSGKRESTEKIFPLVKKYGGSVICLTLDESGIPATAEGRVAIAKDILAAAEGYGIPRHRLVFDPLCMAVSADPNAARETLRAVKMLKDMGLYTSLGVSNVSFGLPARDTVNSTFFTMALAAGLDLAIMNPHSESMMGAYHAFLALDGRDPSFEGYISFTDGVTPTERPSTVGGASLPTAIEKGMVSEARATAEALLSTRDPMEIINGEVIPALGRIGEGFEAGRIYLPSLLLSAEAAAAAFEVIRAHTETGRVKDRCTVVIATVKGDIHDIGKNIVRMLLENYGFRVIDLGKDVSPDAILAAAVGEGARIVALSALMTTTAPAMAETVRILRKEAPRVKIIVGGAVITDEYARLIGADAYAPDAMGAVRYAESVDALAE